jgi:hypothetical protein
MKCLLLTTALVVLLSACARYPEEPGAARALAPVNPEHAIQKTDGGCNPATTSAQQCQPRYVM